MHSINNNMTMNHKLRMHASCLKYLGKPVQGEPIEKDVREELNHAEKGEHDPVHQPLGVIISWRGFNGFH